MMENTFFGLTGSPDAMQDDQTNELLRRLQMAAEVNGGKGYTTTSPFGGIAVQQPDEPADDKPVPPAASEVPKTIAPSADPRYLGTMAPPIGPFDTSVEASPPAGPATTARPQPQVSSAPPMRRAGNIPLPPAASAGGSAPVSNAQASSDLQPNIWDRLSAASNAYDKGGLLGTIATGFGSGLDRQFESANASYKALLANGVDEATAQAAVRNPDIMKQLLASRFGPKAQPQWTVIGEDKFGNKQYGYANPATMQTFDASGRPIGAQDLGTGGAAMGDTSLTGDAYLKSLPDKAESNMVKALLEGRVKPPPLGRKNPYWEKLMEKASIAEPGFDMTKFASRQATRTDFDKGKAAGNIKALETVMGHLDRMDKAIDPLENYGWLHSVTNPVKNYVRDELMNDTQFQKNRADFSLAKGAVASELMKVFRETGGSVTEVKDWENKIHETDSPAALHQTVKSAMDLITSRMDALNNQWNKAFETNRPVEEMLAPKQRALYLKLRGDEVPTDQAPADEPPALNLRGVPDKPPANAPKLDDGSSYIRNPNFNPKLPASNTNPKYLKHTAD